MLRITSAVGFLASILAASTIFAAEPLVVGLWPGETPGDVGIEGEEHFRTYESPILGESTRLVSNVTRPTLTIYQPPKDKNTGTAMLVCPGGGYHNTALSCTSP